MPKASNLARKMCVTCGTSAGLETCAAQQHVFSSDSFQHQLDILENIVAVLENLKSALSKQMEIAKASCGSSSSEQHQAIPTDACQHLLDILKNAEAVLENPETLWAKRMKTAEAPSGFCSSVQERITPHVTTHLHSGGACAAMSVISMEKQTVARDSRLSLDSVLEVEAEAASIVQRRVGSFMHFVDRVSAKQHDSVRAKKLHQRFQHEFRENPQWQSVEVDPSNIQRFQASLLCPKHCSVVKGDWAYGKSKAKHSAIECALTFFELIERSNRKAAACSVDVLVQQP